MSGPHIVGLDHLQIAIPVDADDQAISFYGGVLGLTRIPKPPVLAGRGGAWFDAGNVAVHLGADPAFVPAAKAHPAFVVQDRDALVERLRTAGHDIRSGAEIDGYEQVFTDDPFGNRIELIPAR